MCVFSLAMIMFVWPSFVFHWGKLDLDSVAFVVRFQSRIQNLFTIFT